VGHAGGAKLQLGRRGAPATASASDDWRGLGWFMSWQRVGNDVADCSRACAQRSHFACLAGTRVHETRERRERPHAQAHAWQLATVGRGYRLVRKFASGVMRVRSLYVLPRTVISALYLLDSDA
jgi:hypothetical protein